MPNKSSNRPWCYLCVSFLLLLLGVLIIIIIFSSSKKSRQTPIVSTDNPPEFNESQLTNTMYIGPKPYVLMFRSSHKDVEYGEYFLRDNTNHTEIRLLNKENVCAVPNVVLSPDNTKFLISYFCGDSPVKFMIGVKSESDLSPIPAQDIDSIEKFNYQTEFVSWLTPDTILIKKLGPYGSTLTTTEFWLISYPEFNYLQRLSAIPESR